MNSFTILLFLIFIRGYQFLIPFVKTPNLNDTIVLNVNKSVEYIFDYSKLKLNYPIRVSVESEDADKSAPLIVVVRQKKEVLSWQLPLIVSSNSEQYLESERTLCHDMSNSNVSLIEAYQAIANNEKSLNPLQEEPVLSISTASEKNISVILQLTVEDKFFLEPETLYDITISPSKPRFYFYSFPEHESHEDDYSTVILEITSDDSVCMTVSLQSSSCPIYDLNDDITFDGFYETVNRVGGITISKKKFQNGFFLVFVAKPDDSDCLGPNEPLLHNNSRTKSVRFIIHPSIMYKDYVNAVVVTFTCIAAFYFFFAIAFYVCSSRAYVLRTMEYVSEVDTPSTSATELLDNASLDETEYDAITSYEQERSVILSKSEIYLSDLARKNTRVLTKKSYSYLWHVLTVGLFYLLPAVQLVITYQRVLNDTGNQDLCYYNFLCAHPLGFFSDFNHVFSNIGYILFGLLFMCITYGREMWHQQDLIFNRHYGIPQHYGLFYAMGFALMMEGFLSGSYHICPNDTNFQFDTSFMYVIAVLCMIKLYQTRHPDVNATAYTTFGVLAIAILLGVIGILDANTYFWVIFTIVHLLTCLYLTFQIYYMGCCKFDRGMFSRMCTAVKQNYSIHPLNVIKPMYKGRMVLLLIGNILNWTLAAVGIYCRIGFAVYLLTMFMLNTIYYFIFYIIMKLKLKEKIKCMTWAFLILSLICAATSMYCFLQKSISWSLTPAGSREYNQVCLPVIKFYDYHDMWHFLSAVGMFFIFMVLLTMDDDLSHVPRTRIRVF